MLTIRLHMTWLLTGEGIEIGGGAGLMTVVRVGRDDYLVGSWTN